MQQRPATMHGETERSVQVRRFRIRAMVAWHAEIAVDAAAHGALQEGQDVTADQLLERAVARTQDLVSRVMWTLAPDLEEGADVITTDLIEGPVYRGGQDDQVLHLALQQGLGQAEARAAELASMVADGALADRQRQRLEAAFRHRRSFDDLRDMFADR